MAAQQFGQEFLVNRDLARLQGGEFGLVVVHHDHLVAQVSETRPRHQPHITRSHYDNVHPNAPKAPKPAIYCEIITTNIFSMKSRRKTVAACQQRSEATIR